MTVKFAVWAMISSSALALAAAGVYLLMHLGYVAAQLGVSAEAVGPIQTKIKSFIESGITATDKDQVLGAINMVFQGLNALVTFICSKFVNKKLPSVTEANDQWHWVSVVRTLDRSKKVLRVKRGTMNIAGIHKQDMREHEPNRVITGTDIEINGTRLDPPPPFAATDILVGTLGTERIIFNYQYSGGGTSENGISNLALVRGVASRPWFMRPFNPKNELIRMDDKFLVDGFVGRGEAVYYKNAGEALALYQRYCAELADQSDRTNTT